MARKKDEYQLPEDQASQKFSPDAPVNKMKMLLGALRNKRVLMALGMTVGLFVLTQLISLISHHHKAKEEAVTPPKVTKAVPKPKPVVVKPKPVEPKADFADNQSIELAQISTETAKSSDLNRVRNDVDEIKETFNQRFNSLRHQENKLARDLNRMTYQMDAMRNLLKQMNERQSALVSIQERMLKSELKKKEAQLKKDQPKKKKVVYVLKAAIDGRAWIQDEKSKTTLTVGVGDKINGYGRVTMIDPVRGFVATSSGRTIELGSNDH